MKDTVERMLRSILSDQTINIAYKISHNSWGKDHTFHIARAGKHLYIHHFGFGANFKPGAIAASIAKTIKESYPTK